jgi:ABC-type transport system involved in multi-copper enzyme maturation permease subunit
VRFLRALGALLRFPLLKKELVEKANRRRTYIVRVAYAVCFFGVFAAMNLGLLRQASDLSALLGNGARIFSDAMRLQMIGVFLCLPAMMAGLITHEKERSALSLLLITDLRPWRIVLQKFVGGLVPMFTFLLMALPMSAIAYSLGGVSRGDIVAARIARTTRRGNQFTLFLVF